MKENQIRELVNDLRDIAVEYHGTQQLRERIARTVRAAWLQMSGNSEQLNQAPVKQPSSDEVIGWLRSDYNSDDKRDPNAPLFMLGSNDPSEAWGVKYIPLSGNSPVTPDGYALVPVEPTDEMIAAAMNCEDVLFNSDESFCVQFGNIYEAMLLAAPQQEVNHG
ncbi:hypothetical protein EEN59_14150 [Salmonella enterica]|nr:hypothetical protein [Salmonella enterica]MHI50682.1 hypothetical protein [Salmonella enterica]